MDLLSVDAYSILPQHGVPSPVPPKGCTARRITPELQTVIDQNLKSADFPSGTLVDFDVDPNTRTNTVRDLFLAYAFNKTGSAAEDLANRLSGSMDKRSKPCLLVSAVFRSKANRMVTIWTFPQENAISFSTTPDLSIKLLTDVFSQTSSLRKAAQFEGGDNRTGFLSGHVLDLQATDPSREAADFWVKQFLECTFALTPAAGTRMLARTVQKAFDSFRDLEDKEDLYSAVMAVRASRVRNLSVKKFADQFLPEPPREAFLKSAPYPAIVSSVFKFRRAEFDDVLQFRIFLLHTGVFVSSPLTEIGKSVNVTGNGRWLSCQGDIDEDKMRTRHA